MPQARTPEQALHDAAGEQPARDPHHRAGAIGTAAIELFSPRACHFFNFLL
jgi:hypothetical protein